MLPAFLRQGYLNFRSHRYRQEKQRYEQLAERQTPHTTIIGCCDSRAAPEMIFDANPGELFVVRNVANIVPPYAPDGRHHSTSAALEFSVLALNVAHIVVMGHGRCGGIDALVRSGTPLSQGDFIGQWISTLTPVLENASSSGNNTEVEKAAVVHSLNNLLTFPWIKERLEKGKLSLYGTWFDIAFGELSVYDPEVGIWKIEQEE